MTEHLYRTTRDDPWCRHPPEDTGHRLAGVDCTECVAALVVACVAQAEAGMRRLRELAADRAPTLDDDQSRVAEHLGLCICNRMVPLVLVDGRAVRAAHGSCTGAGKGAHIISRKPQ